MKQTIYLDEAGYTGSKMTDTEQPIFVLAAHSISEDRCSELLKECFPKSQAPEIKHTNVRKTASGQKGALLLRETILKEGHQTYSFAVHKRFSLFQRLFDYLVEPVMHKHGVNAYHNAFNITFSNLGYICLERECGVEYVSELLARFERLIKERTQESHDSFFAFFEEGVSNATKEAQEVFDVLMLGMFEGINGVKDIPENALDVLFSTVVDTVGSWRRKSEGPFVVIHDQSKELAAQKETWDWLTSPAQQEAMLGFGDFRQLPLPMNVESTTAGISHDHAGLQVADILAGTCVEALKLVLGAKCDEDYAGALLNTDAAAVSNNIWPDPDWTPPQSEGQPMIDPLDFTAAWHFAKRNQ
ncbi:MAG: hypothetical protein EOO15_02730 [Chitinophagaceae bacterium]|nr:MAG: hypothetical protein EOO15_02730 [Chitinophagaceae bacterium]